MALQAIYFLEHVGIDFQDHLCHVYARIQQHSFTPTNMPFLKSATEQNWAYKEVIDFICS